ncbi:MAG: sugar phosphate isomerase/epimerase [Candidatus Omnitrophica bacterium]|jgi:sugar phosphate isomerase/epimerase|nr:sugar phosphate isomerase/epimerase [Candidatus Omnitrophota bacterium]MDD5078954.1 sugar phosphate isomerase/epimerase [Candidatus Omnitrophota bacterium]
MGLVFSTSWNAFRHTHAEKLIFEIKELGFNEIELSFNLTADMVGEIEGLVKKAGISVRSVHNFCPIPAGVERKLALPDYYSMSSPDDEERAKAVKQTKGTIDTAARLNASAAVLHCGRVEIPDRTRKLIALYAEGKSGAPEFLELRDQMAAERKTRQKPYFENTLKSLDELNRYADKKGVALGVENRFYYREIPDFSEIGLILNAFKGSRIFYWHDVGHAQVMDNLGLSRHRDYLDLYKDRLFGVHLHDLKGCVDHHAPFTGGFDFKKLLPYLKKDTLKVIEAHYPATPEDIVGGRKILEADFNGKL